MLGSKKVWGVGLLVILLIGCNLPMSQANDTYKFIVKDVKIVPSEVNIGDSVTIMVNLTNPTNATLTDKIDLIINSVIAELPDESIIRQTAINGLYIITNGIT